MVSTRSAGRTEVRPENEERAAKCEGDGIQTCVSALRTRNPHVDGTFFQCDAFRYQPESDTYLCPGEKTLKRKARLQKDKSIIYLANARDCGGCSLKQRCTTSTARRVSRHMFEESLTRMNERATAAVMRLRRSIVEHPFATIKYRILGHP